MRPHDALRHRLPSTPAFVAALVLAACSDLTRVNAPDLVEPSDLNTPQGALALYHGALTIFAGAFNGGLDPNVTGAVVTSGLLTDELSDASVATNRALDAREPDDAGLHPASALYLALSRARVNALGAAQVNQRVPPVSAVRVGHLYAIAGYAEVLLAELVCPGVPLAHVVGGLPAGYGQPLSTTDLLARAVTDFDTAVAYAADSVRITNLARLGRGRALLGQGRYADASAAVSAVPTAYTYVTEHSASVQPNFLARWFGSGLVTVSQQEGGNGLDYRSGDPRVPVAFARKGADGVTDVWQLTSQTAGTASPTTLARGVEARLIEAEAALQAGDAPTYLAKLNEARRTAITPALPDLTDPGEGLSGDAQIAARVDLLFRERAFWLFATASRQGDLRRLSRQYGRSPDSVWPVGGYRGGAVSYGEAVSVAPSLTTQQANPNYHACRTTIP